MGSDEQHTGHRSTSSRATRSRPIRPTAPPARRRGHPARHRRTAPAARPSSAAPRATGVWWPSARSALARRGDRTSTAVVAPRHASPDRALFQSQPHRRGDVVPSSVVQRIARLPSVLRRARRATATGTPPVLSQDLTPDWDMSFVATFPATLASPTDCQIVGRRLIRPRRGPLSHCIPRRSGYSPTTQE